MNSTHVQDFDLSSSLESGQVFRYVSIPDGYLVHHRDRVFRACQKGSNLLFEGAEAGFISQYFALNEDYRAIMMRLMKDGTVKRAAERYWGLRILRQDPWECLISFLCSSSKSIAHIRVLVERLCRAFGEPVSLGDYQGYTFPREGSINDVEKLEAIGLGFRTQYIYQVNRIVKPRMLQRITRRPYEEARTRLMELPGAGGKVADCVLLFSMGFLEAFPVDTWIKRGMERTYFRREKTSSNKIRTYAQDRFGPFAGYAQQYLYHYWREEGKQARTKGDR
jgi:N-glycosylase/DNA lyase